MAMPQGPHEDQTNADAHEGIGVGVSAGTSSVGAAVERLDALTHTLREQCPWDREQTAATIVPHTLEEAYEVADAVRSMDARNPDLAPLVDELGDLLFQVVFLAMLCREQDPTIDLGVVAAGIHDKLVRRHPHVFGDEVAESADDVRGTWEAVKRTQEGRRDRGLFDGITGGLPAVSRTRKVQQRAASVGFDFATVDDALAKLQEEVGELREALAAANEAGTLSTSESQPADEQMERELGDVLFAAINVARMSRCDPELALRDASGRFTGRVELAIELAGRTGEQFTELSLDEQEAWYQAAKAQLSKR